MLHADKGYDYRHLLLALRKRRIIPCIPVGALSPKKNRLGPATAWVVERTLSWLNRFWRQTRRRVGPVRGQLQALLHARPCAHRRRAGRGTLPTRSPPSGTPGTLGKAKKISNFRRSRSAFGSIRVCCQPATNPGRVQIHKLRPILKLVLRNKPYLE